MLSKNLAKFYFSAAQSSKHIGFVGLGNMGAGMARNLAKQFQVTAFDVMPETRQRLREEGLNVVEDLSEIQQNSEIQHVVLMVPAAQHVRGMLEGENGFFNNWKGTIIDCSTIGVNAAQEFHKLSENTNVSFVDAPVSGGIMAANNGALTFMVGNRNEQQFKEVEEILNPMAKSVFDCKQPAGGQIAKTCNNMALAIQMMSVSEALNLGTNLGMDAKVLSDIMSTATGSCWSLNVYNPCPGVLENIPSANNYKGGFATQLMAKDLGLSMEAAQSSDSSVPFGEKAAELYKELTQDSELAGRDFSQVYELLKNKRI